MTMKMLLKANAKELALTGMNSVLPLWFSVSLW
jgi:hypothetical protein